MMRLIQVITLFLCMVVAACSFDGDTLPHYQQVRLSDYSPIDLLEIVSNRGDGHIFVLNPEKNWVKEKDVPVLIQHITSSEKSMSVAQLSSSYIDNGQSTIGNEAYFMLLGYKHGVYPPALNSTRHHLESREELLVWLENESFN